MAARKPQDVLRINVSQTDRQQSQLVEYLRKSGQITSQSMEAIKSYWYSYALAADPQASDIAVEMAAIESVICLSSQINRILNFHRLDRQIILPNEVLIRCGLIPRSEPAVPPAKSLPLPTIPASPQPLTCSTVSATAVHEASALPEDSALRFDDDSAQRSLRERSEAEDDSARRTLRERDRQTHAGLKLSSSVASFLYGES
jgi:hypothetical protein